LLPAFGLKCGHTYKYPPIIRDAIQDQGLGRQYQESRTINGVLCSAAFIFLIEHNFRYVIHANAALNRARLFSPAPLIGWAINFTINNKVYITRIDF